MTSALKVLEIGLEWFPEHGGGLDRYFHDLIAHAPLANLDIRGLVAGSEAAAAATGGRVRSFAGREQPILRRLLAARRSIAEEIATFRPALVASHFALHVTTALDRLDVPLVVHFQGPWAAESAAQGHGCGATIAKRAIERRAYRRATRCIVLSTAFAGLLARDYGVDPARIEVVPPSIDVDRFAGDGLSRPAARERLGWPAGRRTVLAVRRLVKRMGLETLIEAVALTVRTHPDLLVMIAGRGPERAALRARIEGLGLDAHVRLLGYVPDADLPLAYRAADLTIVPTEALEGFGLITAESLAAGTPAMVTPVGGLPEAVSGLSSELVLADIDVDSVAAGLDRWLDGNVALPDEDACRGYARERFAWPVGMARIGAVYRQAAGAA